MELFCEVFDKKGSFQVLLLLLEIFHEDGCICYSVYILHVDS